MVLFEQNDISVITMDGIYNPHGWMLGLLF